MQPLQNLFRFPILMVDGTLEEKKTMLGLPGQDQLDVVQGFAECPFQDFVSVTDRWLPTSESFEKAQEGDFEACFVVFATSGHFIVPWTREKFKKEFQAFVENLPQETPIIHVTKEQMKKILESSDNKEKDDGEEFRETDPE